jgi:mannose-1-phosphate guanylyltransferase
MITPVILSGGDGTRLWPASSPDLPKQFLPLVGPESLFELALARFSDRQLFAPPIIVAGQAQADILDQQIACAAIAGATVILEPAPRNTALAVALAAVFAPPDALLLIAPSDHILAAEAFKRSVQTGISAAEAGWLVTFGIRPTRAETGYGYILQGEGIALGVHVVERFLEKPCMADAERFFRSGEYAWNAGILLTRAGALLTEFEEHAPDILASARAALATSRAGGGRIHPDPDAVAASRSVAIDVAVLERSRRVATVPTDMAWSDLGSWDSLYEVLPKDDHGNALQGEALAFGSENNLLRSDAAKIVAINVHNMAIVAENGVILVVPRRDSQRVKEAVLTLRNCAKT